MMDTTIVRSEDGNQLNRFGEQVIDCEQSCGRQTTMLGTRLCDGCWEQRNRERRDRMLQHHDAG